MNKVGGNIFDIITGKYIVVVVVVVVLLCLFNGDDDVDNDNVDNDDDEGIAFIYYSVITNLNLTCFLFATNSLSFTKDNRDKN